MSLICLGLSPPCPKYFSQNQKRENRLKSRPGAGAYTTRSWRTPIRGLLMKTEMRVCLHLIKSFLLHKLHHRPHTFFRDFFFWRMFLAFFQRWFKEHFCFFSSWLTNAFVNLILIYTFILLYFFFVIKKLQQFGFHLFTLRFILDFFVVFSFFIFSMFFLHDIRIKLQLAFLFLFFILLCVRICD